MTTFFVSAILAFLILAYWTSCRKASLAYQTKAVDLMERYFERNDVAEKEVETLYWSYKLGRQWFFLPMMALLSPIVILVELVRSGGESLGTQNKSKEHNEIMENIMFMYISKNPLLSAACFAFSYVVISLMLLIGLICRRLTTFPKPSSVLEVLAVRAARRGGGQSGSAA